MHRHARLARRASVYFILAIAPLVFNLVSLDPGRGFWVNLSVSFGFVGLALLGLQFALAARSVRIHGVLGSDVLLQFHRQITVLIAVLIYAHPIILFFWDPRFLALLNIFTSPLRAKLAVIACVMLLLLIITSVWRRKLGLRYPVWQALHTALALIVVITGLLHVLLIGYYVNEPWEQALWMVYSAVFIWIGVWVRVISPIRRWHRRWRVVKMTEQPQHSHTVTLEVVNPKSYGPNGFRFEAGQYAWIHTGQSPFALTYHPFSISSSAESANQVEFTIKTEQGMTTTIHDLPIGRIVYLDGPWGDFSLDRYAGPGYVFVAAGVGVTPMLSMLATLADRGDPRPCYLILGNRRHPEIIGRDEIDQLEKRLDLTVTHVISQPHADWTGAKGRINAELLDRLLPTNRADLQYFMCGPDPMMDAAEVALDQLGVPAGHVHAERFTMV